jgi:CBS domain-containing protein
MSVRHILAHKGEIIEAITPDATLSEAILRLASKRIGALLVIDASGRVAGILSERDIVRALVAGSNALRDSVRDHMTQNVITCTATASVGDIMDVMTRGRFRHVPVVEAGELIGIISIGDVVKYRLAEIEAEKSAMLAYIATG